MSKRSVSTPVSAKEIRTAFHEGNLDATKVLDAKGNPVNAGSLFGGPQGRGRGRLNPAFVQAYLDANPGTTYAEKSEAEVAKVTLDLTKPNARGARLKRPEAVPVAEVRARAGVSGKRGRLSAADKQAAAESIMRERGWL